MSSEILGVADVLRVGARVAAVSSVAVADVDVRVFSARPSFRLAVADGAQLHVGPAVKCDVLVVPGFDAAADGREMDSLLAGLGPEKRLIREQFDAGTQLVSVCVGAFLLAEAGVLDGRRATTSWLHAPILRARHPLTRVEDDHLVVRDRGVTTAAAYSAMYDMTLDLLKELFGHRTADRTAAIMLLDSTRERQTPYIDERLLASAGTSFGATVQRWLRNNLDAPYDLEMTAAQFSVSTRTLSRKFVDDTGTTPLKYLHAERMRRAKHLLGSTSQSVTEISRRVGYRDAATFSQLFKRHVGLAPRDYRTRFASSSR
jgi:transcriptional regulator GlxA family with amidase domain